MYTADFSLASSDPKTSFQSPFRTLPESQQLIQNWVRAIVQDDQGFLWVGTLGGLHRFDGQKMLLVNELVSDGSFLDVVRVNALAIDGSGGIWVGGVYGALDLVLTVEGVVEHYSGLTSDGGDIDLGRVTKICPLPDGNALIGDGFSIYIIDRFNHTVEKLPIQWPTESNETGVNDFLLMDKGKLLISNKKEIGLLDLETSQVVCLPLDNQDLNEDFLLRGIEQLKDGSIWAFGNNTALYQLVSSGQSYHFRVVPLPTEKNLEFIDLALTPGGTFWFILQGKDMATWNPISDKFKLINLGPDQRDKRENRHLSNIFIDRSGVIWIGTGGYGLRFRDPSGERFDHLRGKETSPFGFADPYIWQIYEDGEGIVVMGHRELVRFDPVSGETRLILDTFAHPDMAGLPDLSTFAPFSEGVWLLGFGNKMLGIFDQRDNSFRPLTQYMDLWNNLEDRPRCRQLERDTKGRVWIFTQGKTWILDPKSGKLSVPSTKLDQALNNSEVRVMLESRDGSFWFGTDHSGLVHYNPNNDTVQLWKGDSKPGDLAYPGVRALYEKENGDIWIGTYNGLNVLRAVERRRGGQYLEQFTVQDGLPNNMIYSILPGDDDELWFATNMGLCRLREKSNTWKNFTRLDGLANNEFNGGAQLRSSAGYLLFGGIEGLTWFKPGEQMENLVVPLVSLTHVYNSGVESKNLLGIPNLKRVYLPWDGNRLEFELATLDFQQSGDHQVAYRIDGVDGVDGVDDQWWYAPAGQHIHLASLPSGSMILHYCGVNNDGVWSEPGKLIIEVGTQPWRTKQALLFYVLVISSLFAIVVKRARRMRLEKEEIKQQMIIADKLRAMGLLAGGLAHDFGNYLQVILAHSDMARRRVPAGHPAERSLDKLFLAGEKAQQMVQRLLTLVRDDEPSLEVVNLDLLIRSMRPILESLVNKEVRLEIDHGPEGKFFKGNIDQIEQILTNLCSNSRDAINGPGKIVIRTRWVTKSDSQEWCQLSVIDNGKGVSPQDIPRIFEPFYSSKHVGKGTGLGLAIVFNIIESHKGKVFVSSNLGQGTTIDVLFPRVQSLETNQPK